MSAFLENPGLEQLLGDLRRWLAAGAEALDRSGEFPRDNFAELQRLGLLGLTVPQAFGGAGAGLREARQVIAAVARGEPSTALILVMQYLQHARLQNNDRWPAELRERVARDAVEHGALINALRVEPDLGTPARGGLPASVARRSAEGWRLSGRKIYSTGCHGLTWMLVWARSDDPDPLVGAWLVHRDSPGVRIVENWDHLGMRATGSHEVVFEEVLLPLPHAVSVAPQSAPLPEFDEDGLLWMAVLVASVYDGIARAARDCFVDWAVRRRPSNLGASLATLGNFQEALGRIDSLLFANQALLDLAVDGRLPPRGAGPLKYLVTNQAIQAVEVALKISGNPGLDRRNALERHYRNVLCGRIHTPQDDTLLLAVGQAGFAPALAATR